VPQRYALAPLAIAPGALLLALLYPAALDPIAPFATLPPGVWILFLIAAAAPAATVYTVRLAYKDDRVGRARALVSSGIAVIIAAVVAASAGFAFANPLMVKGGAGFALLALAMVGLAAACGAVAVVPRSRFIWGILVGELLIANVTRGVFHAPATAEEWVRLAMVIAPGWGKETLGSIGFRRIPHPHGDPDYERELRAIDEALEQVEKASGFEGLAAAWHSDERVVRGWVEQRLAQAPELSPEDRKAALTGAVTRYLAFAEDPAARLQPWTRGGILGEKALGETDDLGDAPDDLRLRVAVAWDALELLELELADPSLEARAVAAIRKLFDEAKLDRGSLIYLETYSLELRRKAEAGDAPGYLALLDGWAKGDWPEGQKKAFQRQADFVRKYPAHDYAPVMKLILARIQVDHDLEMARETYLSILKAWPDDPVAALARQDLASLPALSPGASPPDPHGSGAPTLRPVAP